MRITDGVTLTTLTGASRRVGVATTVTGARRAVARASESRRTESRPAVVSAGRRVVSEGLAGLGCCARSISGAAAQASATIRKNMNSPRQLEW
jgi:hypothetical protein